MTPVRIIFAVLMVILGFALYSLHRDVSSVRADIAEAGKAIGTQLTTLMSSVTSTKDRIDKMYNLTYGKATIHRAVPRVAPPPKALPPHKNFWDDIFKK